MLKTTNQARNLGVIMVLDLNFSSHSKTFTKSAYYQLKKIPRIKELGRFGKNLSKNLSSADLTTGMVSLQDSLKH